MSYRGRTVRLAAAGAAAALVVAACGDDTDTDPPEPDIEAPDDDADPEVDLDPPEEPAEPDEGEPTDEGEPADDDEVNGENGTDEEATDDPEDGVERLPGEPSTDESSEDGEFGSLAVTDVRVAAHDGFDRVVFELTGDDGVAGWSIRYDAEPTSQGSGEPIEVDGAAYLAVAIHNVALPPELPDDVQVWDGPLAGPEGGVVTEVVSDTVFEGIHTFVIGTSGEAPFVVERFEDPQRVVIDVVHDG